MSNSCDSICKEEAMMSEEEIRAFNESCSGDASDNQEEQEGNDHEEQGGAGSVALFWQQHFLDESQENHGEDEQNQAPPSRRRCSRDARRRSTAEHAQRYDLDGSSSQYNAYRNHDHDKKTEQRSSGARVRRRRAPRRSSTGTMLGNNSRMPLRQTSLEDLPPPLQVQLAQASGRLAPARLSDSSLDSRHSIHRMQAHTAANARARQQHQVSSSTRSAPSTRQSRASRQRQRSPTRSPPAQVRRAHTMEPRKSPTPAEGSRFGAGAGSGAGLTSSSAHGVMNRSNAPAAATRSAPASTATGTTTNTRSPPTTRGVGISGGGAAATRRRGSFQTRRSRSPTRRRSPRTMRRAYTLEPSATRRPARRLQSPLRSQQQQNQQQQQQHQQVQLDEQLQHMCQDCEKLTYMEGGRRGGAEGHFGDQQGSAHDDPDNTPGAFSVAGLDASMGDSSSGVSMHESSYNTNSGIHHRLASQGISQAPPLERGQTRRPSSPVLAIATAVLVNESNDANDILSERNSLAQKQLELAEREERLAEQAAKLKAWEEQLERRRLEMEAQVMMQAQPQQAQVQIQQAQPQQSEPQQSEPQQQQDIVLPEPEAPTAVVQASHVVSEPTLPPVRVPVPVPVPTTTNTSRRPRLMRGFLSTRDIRSGQSTHSGATCSSNLSSGVSSLDSAGLASITALVSRVGNDSPMHSLDSAGLASITAQVSRIVVGSGGFGDEGRGPSDDIQAPEDDFNDSLDMALARAELGDGPLRFAPRKTYSLDQVLARLSPADQKAFRGLKERWENRQAKRMMKYGGGKKQKKILDLPLQWHLRYLHLCAKQHKKDQSYYFSVEKAWNSERKVQRRFLNLNAFKLTEQLESKTLFPVPGLKTSGGHDMFYMRPSRYFPNKTSVKAVIDNLCYVMNTMLENNEFAQKEGIGFVACMDDWKMKNFDVNYCFQFMMGLQGFMVPVKTQLFLIVNPPSWFGGIWRIMKPMLAPSFRKRVKIVPEKKIAKYLAPGYERYLPDDMQTGLADTDAMVRDFIAFRKFVERDSVLYGDEDAAPAGGSDAQSVAPSESEPIPHNLDYEDMRSMGRWSLSSDHSSVRSHSGNSSNQSLGDDDDDDGASIHCDIHDDEMLDNEDMKQAATPENSSVHFDYLPAHIGE